MSISVDMNNINKVNNKVVFWAKNEFTQEQNINGKIADVILEKIEIDCSKGTYRFLFAELYYKNEVQYTNEQPDYKNRTIIPGTFIDPVYEIFCKK